VGVVELEVILGREVGKIIAVPSDPVAQNVLKTRRSQKILLAQTQFLAVFVGIIRYSTMVIFSAVFFAATASA
jgi:hypothetical protein